MSNWGKYWKVGAGALTGAALTVGLAQGKTQQEKQNDIIEVKADERGEGDEMEPLLTRKQLEGELDLLECEILGPKAMTQFYAKKCSDILKKADKEESEN